MIRLLRFIGLFIRLDYHQKYKLVIQKSSYLLPLKSNFIDSILECSKIQYSKVLVLTHNFS
jgi:hypothetical protein